MSILSGAVRFVEKQRFLLEHRLSVPSVRSRPGAEGSMTTIKLLMGAMSVAMITVATIHTPVAATLQCPRERSSILICGAHARAQAVDRQQLAARKGLQSVREERSPDRSETARIGSWARSCDVSGQISRKARDTALSKNCVTGPAMTRDTLAERRRPLSHRLPPNLNAPASAPPLPSMEQASF